MHDAAFLHIRSRDGRATRIVSLTEPSVRIGRGRSCEVRLDDPALAEVECLLRRRGDAWHLQPVSPSGRLTLDGRPADRPRALPFGATLRMADRWLTLLPTMDAPETDADLGLNPESGPTVLDVSDPEPSLIPELEPVRSSSGAPVDPSPEPETTDDSDDDVDASSDPLESRKAELARLESRLRQRERWLKDRLHERQWEARWRAAGASLKSRGRASDPPEPRPRSTTAPPRPTVATGPSLKERREVVPPTSPRFDRPTPAEAPSYRVPADRVPTTPPSTPDPIPTPVEPPIGRGLRGGPVESRVDREPFPSDPVKEPEPIAPSPASPIEVAVALAVPDPIVTEPAEPEPVIESLGATTEADPTIALADPEPVIEPTPAEELDESESPAGSTLAEGVTLPPPIGRIGGVVEEEEARVEEEDESDLLGSLAEEFAESLERGRAEALRVEPDPEIVEETLADSAIAPVSDAPACDEESSEDRPLEPVGLIENERPVTTSEPECDPEPTEADSSTTIAPEPSALAVDAEEPEESDQPQPEEEVGTRLAIRGVSAGDPAEHSPESVPAESVVLASDAPDAAAVAERVTLGDMDQAGEVEGPDGAIGDDSEPVLSGKTPRVEDAAEAGSAAPRRWGLLPTIDLSDLVSFLSRPDRSGSPTPEEVTPPAPVDPAVEVAPPAESRAVEPVEVQEQDEESEGFGADPGAIEDDTFEGFAEVGESVAIKASGEWPSAKAMLGEGTVWERRKRPSRNRITGDMPIPTDRIAPDEWTVPGGAWLCIPLMFVCLAIGVMGVRLSWTWAGMDRDAGLLSNQLAQGKRPEAGRIERLLEKEEEMPGASWWNSTSDQMILRAALRSGPGNLYDPASQERAGALLHAASSTAPGHPSLRFAHAWRALQEPGNDPPSTAVGLSRDIWSLAWSGRALLTEGKLDEAKRAYRSALDMACRARPDPTLMPTFHGENRGGRFALPLEEVISVVVTDMANRPEWSLEDWEPLLPDFAGAWLVGARVLRQRGDSASADRLLDRAVALGDAPSPAGSSQALHEASSAEALALLGRFEESAERYSLAVDRRSGADLGTAERAWMFNLAELHGRLGNAGKERSCLLASMITDPSDPITSQAIRTQLRRGLSLVGDDEGDEQDEAGLAATAASARTRPSRSLGD